MKDMYPKYAPICVALYQKKAADMQLIGTAFFIAAKGYLLTALEAQTEDKLFISFRQFKKGYFQINEDSPVFEAVTVQQYSNASGLALLKTKNPIEQMVPLKIFDLDEDLLCGTALPCLLYNQQRWLIMRQVLLGAKLQVGAKKVYLLDLRCNELANGGPVINPQTGLVAGIINQNISKRLLTPENDMTYALDIQHALELLTAENFYVR